MALDKAAFTLSLLAIVSLAVIGGLAPCLFYKGGGCGFSKGNPEAPAAENVNEKRARNVGSHAGFGRCLCRYRCIPQSICTYGVKGSFVLGNCARWCFISTLCAADGKYYNGGVDFLCPLPSDSVPSLGLVPGQDP